jgi:probable O-glycosylation ligase (exosortase A-associated)
MRDIALSLVIFGLLPFVFKYPVLGAYLWAWVSMMNPQKMTYGFAYDMPFAMIIAVVTLLNFLFTKKKFPLPRDAIVIVYFALLAWMTVTCFFAMAPAASVFDRWLFVMKTHVMLFVTLMLVRERKHLVWLVWVVTLSVVFFGIKGGVWTVLTGGGGRVWGPPGGMLQGNNELAVALVMLMPFLYYLQGSVTQRWGRYLIAFFMVATAFAILGSQSRGALLALVAMLFFLGLKGKHPVRTSVVMLALGALVIGFMPESWTARMDTIDAYQQDSSAMSRVWAWKTMYAAALDRPIVGVGFGADSAAVYSDYAPQTAEFQQFEGRVFVAHSIYFQMLGEHGFVGLGLFLLLGLTTWWTAGRLARKTRDDPEFGPWMPLLMRMTQVSLIGYAVGGAFLSLAYLDLPYYIVGYVVICDALVRQRARALTGQPAAAPAPYASQPVVSHKRMAPK